MENIPKLRQSKASQLNSNPKASSTVEAVTAINMKVSRPKKSVQTRKKER